ncbi:MFS transporter [Paenalcaligenes niemegkensis]|uniref:MFS transporter n=1 Tax=Paenalcaligenes niemegkensis TaxID=2895469 RepID=UPI001EE8CA5F|nr:MFS transporter [Paenalcaligenes niemegkensis]MCQ9616867.1 MFS transporter [Paenalcaligenes niemegkensis]
MQKQPVKNSTFSAALRADVSKRELWAWAMYDFANSGYTTVVLTTVFSAYFVGVVAAGKTWGTLALTMALSFSYLLVMLSMPTLGARADTRARKRHLLFSSTVGCVIATMLLSRSVGDDIAWALSFIVISNYFYCVGESVIGAFLPEIAKPEALGRVSGWGWGFGYFGGMLTLGIALFIVTRGEALGQTAEQYVPLVILLTAIVFALAAVPSFLWLKERSPASNLPVVGVFRRLGLAWKETRDHFPDLGNLLICGAFYQAGIAVVITLSSVYATQAMGFTMSQTMLLVFTVNIAAAIGAMVFGHVQDRLGHKLALGITLVGWLLMVGLAASATSTTQFWVSAAVAGLCIGSSQSAGRAMVGAFTPEKRLGEFYALWTFSIQLAAVVGPLCYGLVSWLTEGNHRLALGFTSIFFIAGLVMLWRIDFNRGMAQKLRAA